MYIKTLGGKSTTTMNKHFSKKHPIAELKLCCGMKFKITLCRNLIIQWAVSISSLSDSGSILDEFGNSDATFCWQQTVFTADILTCHGRSSTGVTNYIINAISYTIFHVRVPLSHVSDTACTMQRPRNETKWCAAIVNVTTPCLSCLLWKRPPATMKHSICDTYHDFLESKLNEFKLMPILQTHGFVTLARTFLCFHVWEH